MKTLIFLSALSWKQIRILQYSSLLQSWPKYMRQTLMLVWNSALRENFNFNFEQFFAYIDKIFILRGRLSFRQDCLKNFLLHFISPLRVPLFENSNFVVEICFIFLKTCPRSNFKSLSKPQWKDRKNSYQVKQIFSLLCKLVTLISD